MPTTYYLTIADRAIRTHCEMNFVEFVPMNDINAFSTGNPMSGLQPGGTCFVQSIYTDPHQVWEHIPEYARRIIRNRNIRVLYLDAASIARTVASVPDLQVRMQGIVLLGVFLKSTPFLKQRGLSQDELMIGVEKSLRKYFGKRGDQIVQDNLTCVRRGFSEVLEVPQEVIHAGDPAHSNGKLVQDVMSSPVFACRPTTSVDKIAQTMASRGIQTVVVVDSDGNLQGWVNSSDIEKAKNGNGSNGNHKSAEQIMSRNVSTTSPTEHLDAAMKLINDKHLPGLVVVQGENGHQKPVGMLSVGEVEKA